MPRFHFETLNRITSRNHPDADAATLCKYDDLGRVRFSQDARQRAAGMGANRKITYTVYDDFGRVTRVGEAAANFASLDKVVEVTLSISLVMTNLCYVSVFDLSYSHSSDILLLVIYK